MEMTGATAAPGATPPPSAPAIAAKPAPPPPAPSDDFVRYGKILSPNDQTGYPFKLTMPGPGFGELKVPNAGELAMREKLERLANLSDAEIRAQLEQWPAFSKMSLGDQGAMLTRIQQFRDHRNKMAQVFAHQLGILTLNPQQQARFEQEYWDKRLQMDHQLSQQFEPAVKAADQKLKEELFREFSKPGQVAQGAKPPAPGLAQAKPPLPKSTPIVTTPPPPPPPPPSLSGRGKMRERWQPQIALKKASAVLGSTFP